MSRVLSLFVLLARQPNGLSLTEISQALGVSKSTFLNSLRALTADGHLICENNLYRLGPSAFRLAGTIMSAWSAPDIIRHYLRELAQATSESSMPTRSTARSRFIMPCG
jgi:DNA-binding IclR family transcriptional regulator